MIGVVAIAAAACGGGDGDNADADGDRTPPTVGVSAADGKSLYDATCVACHADGGVGIDGLGKPLANSDFIKGISDPDLVALIKVGRDTSDPANTSGVAMPAKGGNPALSDADLQSIVAYLRTLN
jgi:disulfide bond formation protein DsbB